jgi:hypothetical protein
MKITRVETHVCNARMRNWVFVKVLTDQPWLLRGPVRDHARTRCHLGGGNMEEFYEDAADDAKRFADLARAASGRRLVGEA